MAYTYSFTDIHITIGHPAVGAKTTDGAGIGEVTIAYTTDNTAIELGADGTPMVSKIKSDIGTVAIQVQQTSDLSDWLLGYFNKVYALPSDQWSQGYINISAANGLGNTIEITGVSHTKRADHPFQQQGQMVTWNFMAQRIDSAGSLASAIYNTSLIGVLNG